MIGANRLTGERSGLSIVVPAYNEAANLPLLAERLTAILASLPYAPEIIVVDDGSIDATKDIIRSLHKEIPHLKAIHLSRNFGKEQAVATGLMHASGNAVILMDADLQHPPDLIPELLSRYEAGYDMVFAVRDARDTDTRGRRIASRLFYAAFNIASGTRLPEGAGDYRLLSRKAVDAMNRLGERRRFNKGLYAWIGFRSIGVPYTVAAREGGKSKWSTRKLLSFALDGVATFSILPLRIASCLGFLTSLAALAYAAVFLVKTLVLGIDLPGFPSLIVSIMFFSGIQLICLGLLGEYLGRVYEEVKGRPLVIIDHTLGFGATQSGSPQSTINESCHA